MPKKIPTEALLDLKRRLDSLPAKSSERRTLMQSTADFFGISEVSLYRKLRENFRYGKTIKRSDYGKPRIASKESMERYCEVIAAIRIRTSNKKGRHLSTQESIRLLEKYGVNTHDGFVKSPEGLLNKSTVNRYLKLWGFHKENLSKEPPSVKFQAEYSNDCWHFDLSPSDLKKVERPPWVREGKNPPTLMLFSVVDDRSGVAYQEYKCVYGEDAESALRFLFNAMSTKDSTDIPFQGIPKMIYMDNGPISKSYVFRQVMDYLGIEVKTHLPAGKDGNRTTARSKGKVERPFRTVKEMYESLYHFHKPETEDQANQWLQHFIWTRYNQMNHRSESHSRIEDWLKNLHPEGLQSMCSWEKFCSFAREPEERLVNKDCIVTLEGVEYVVSPELSGEKVLLWWGLFDQELFVELDGQRFGPYFPDSGPIPLHRYRSFRKPDYVEKNEKIERIAKSLKLTREALDGGLQVDIDHKTIEVRAFERPAPFESREFSSVINAKKAISEKIKLPLAKLSQKERDEIDDILSKSLDKAEVFKQVEFLKLNTGVGENAH